MGSLASVITLLGDLRDEFGLSETQLGLIVGAGFFAAFVTQLTLARVADRGHAPLRGPADRRATRPIRGGAV
ncbi:MAG: hypothetical protein F4Z64_13230, partial [Acidimicrobiaceae bacterium]|nr:hypothetical protein [Acidimicrobiaceae bacterium]